MRLRQPNLHARLHPKISSEFVRCVHEVVKRGGGMPAFFNDETVVPAIERLGVATRHACDDAIVGCVEWGVPRRSFPAAGAGFLSLPAALQRALPGGRDPASNGAAARFDSMEALVAALRDEIDALVAEAVAGNDAIERAHAWWRPTPFLSLLVDGCVASGHDVTQGGARYNSTGMQGVGVADVADSLAAIERLVFEERRVGLAELVAAADADFIDHPELQRRLERRVSRYGCDAGRREHWAKRVVEIYSEAVRRHRNPRGGPYAPGFWTMTTHVGLGRRLGALPSGRRAGRPLSDAVSPVNGADRGGPTASLAGTSRNPARSPARSTAATPWFISLAPSATGRALRVAGRSIGMARRTSCARRSVRVHVASPT